MQILKVSFQVDGPSLLYFYLWLGSIGLVYIIIAGCSLMMLCSPNRKATKRLFIIVLIGSLYCSPFLYNNISFLINEFSLGQLVGFVFLIFPLVLGIIARNLPDATGEEK